MLDLVFALFSDYESSDQRSVFEFGENREEYMRYERKISFEEDNVLVMFTVKIE